MTKAKRSITFLLTCLALLAGVSALQAERKPNVLLIAVDDLNDWVGLHLNHDFYTHKLLRTGELDVYKDVNPYPDRAA